MNDAKTLKATPLRELGKDEYWLQDYICADTACLDLGEMMVVYKEKVQASGGRLDILLRSLDEQEFYEVEVMLGETDPSHIIRTIEYWDQEKKKWPKRNHTAVLVAERINSRFYNIINLLSRSVPIIGIQVAAYKFGDEVHLAFTKIIDSYQEPETEDIEGGNGASVVDENPYVREIGDCFLSMLRQVVPNIKESKLKWGLSYYNGSDRLAKILKRGHGRVTIGISIEVEDQGKAMEVLKATNVECDVKYDDIRLWVSLEELRANQDAVKSVLQLFNKN